MILSDIKDKSPDNTFQRIQKKPDLAVGLIL